MTVVRLANGRARARVSYGVARVAVAGAGFGFRALDAGADGGSCVTGCGFFADVVHTREVRAIVTQATWRARAGTTYRT
jgi:hypothetical protein